jgi:diguanylate cyclase (GGDEF)-like protein
MYSLFYVLSKQHGEEVAPVRCNEQTIMRLVRYFEDVVTENKLSALVLEGRCPGGDHTRERERMEQLAAVARYLYYFSCDSNCESRTWNPEPSSRLSMLEEPDYHNIETGPFVLVMDQRFCGLLASYALSDGRNDLARTYEMLWTFDPNAVFTAIEYLMARITVQRPQENLRFGSVLNASTPHSVSLRLALSLTTKLTMLMQRQNELEMAINRISSAISSTLELESILQNAVEEVGVALNARRAALVLWQEGTSKPESMSVYDRPESPAADRVEASDQSLSSFGQTPAPESAEKLQMPGPLEVPITYRNSVIGVLSVEDDTPGRTWEDEEVLMVRTVSDQLAVAISHARLFIHVRNQAMTDALTGLYNHRYFQDRLEREVKLADRNNEQVSLILLDLDHLKKVNDTHGHRSGDNVLCQVAKVMQSTVREVDVCARYGGEEFVVVLPQCGRESAITVAERLREAIASTNLPGIGQVTASLGVASYPAAAKTKEELIEMADRAMYLAKAAGRNRVRTLMHHQFSSLNG